MKRIIILLSVVLMCVVTANAQVANYTFSQSSGIYTAITGGTILATATTNSGATSLDNAIYNVAGLPFTFTFNGVSYTGFNVSTNGFITFGTNAPATSYYTPNTGSTAYAGSVSPWGRDISGFFNLGGRTSQIRWEVIGTAPNREIVVQWQDMRPMFTTSTTNVYGMSYQIRLKETANTVQIVYGGGSFAVGSTAISGNASTAPQVGLRGASNTDFNNRTNATTALFSASTAGTTNSTSITQSFNTSVTTPGMPVSGLTYTWSPPVPCTGTPALGNTITSATAVCSGSTATLSLQNTPTSSGIVYQWQSSTNGGTWTTIAGATGTSYTPTVTVPAEYKCVAMCSNSGQSGESTPVTITLAPFNQCYCASSATNTANEDIIGVTFNGSTNSSTCATTGTGSGSILNRYSDYTPLSGVAPNYVYAGSFAATQGTTVPMSVQIGTCGGNFNNAVAVWIDFNQNGVFDATEKVYSSTATTNGPHTETATIAIPATATLGLTGMRVINSETSIPANPCGTYTYGETEDYLVNIVAGCTGIPTAGTINTTYNCAANSSTLTLQGASTGTGINYQWQSSPDGITWTNISGETGTSYIKVWAEWVDWYYRCNVTCANSAQTAATPSIIWRPLLPPALTTTPVSCNGGNNGTVNITPCPQGHMCWDTYLWSNGQTTQNIVNLVAGTYTVTVTNSVSGCTKTADIILIQPVPLNVSLTSANNLDCTNTTSVLTATGGTMYNFGSGFSAASTNTVTIANTYTVTVQSSNSCTATATVELTAVITPIAIPTNGLIAYYPFNCGANDMSGNNNHGIPIGATLTTDRFGNPNSAYSFDGVNDYINLPTIGSSTFPNNYTISTWVKFNSFTNDYPLIFNGENNFLSLQGCGSAYIPTNNFKKASWYWSPRSFQAPEEAFSTNPLVENQYYHLVAVKNGTNVLLYLDGVLQSSAINLNTLGLGSFSRLGGYTTNNMNNPTPQENALHGDLDDIRIYNRALTLCEIQALYQETSTQPNLVVNGDFSQGNTGFTTDFTLFTYPQSCAYLMTDPSFYYNMHDHTPNNNDEKLLLIDDCGNPNYTAWQQNISVQTNSSYAFSFWAQSHNYTPQLEVSINGVVVNTFLVQLPALTWQQFTLNWASGNNTNAVIRIRDLNLYNEDHNYSIDDITFKRNNCCTTTITGNSTICANAVTQICASSTTGIAPFNYAWSNGTMANCCSVSAGTYTVTVADSNGCTATATTTINVNPPPTATITTINNCNGYATLTATGGISYVWSNGGTGSTITVTNSDTYTVTATDANGCMASTGTTVVVWPILTATATTIQNVSCNGGSDGAVNFIVAGGTCPYNVTNPYPNPPTPNPNVCTREECMRRGTGNACISGTCVWACPPINPNGDTLPVRHITLGIYSITVTDANGCIATTQATVTEPPVSNQTTNITACDTYTWAVNGMTYTASGTYTATSTNANGCTIAETLILTIYTTPIITIVDNNNNIVSGTSVCLDATATYCAQSTPSTVSYQWSTGSTASCITGIPIPAEYTVVCIAGNSCSASATLNIVAPPLAIAITATADIDNQTFTVTGNGFTNTNYVNTFYINGITATPTAPITATSATLAAPLGYCDSTYTISFVQSPITTIATATSCYTTNTTTVIANFWRREFYTSQNCGIIKVTRIQGRITPIGFNWTLRPCNAATPAYSGSSTTGQPICTTAFAPGCYILCISLLNSPSACSDYCKQITIAPPPTAAIIGATTACGSVTLTATGGITYAWSGGSSPATATNTFSVSDTYTVTITDATGCTATASKIVEALSLPTASITGNSTFCPGDCVTLTATGGITYVWSSGGSSSTTTVCPTLATTYTVTVTAENGCTATATKTLTKGLYCNPCPNCPVGSINISTGFNNSTNSLFANGSTDDNWILTNAPTTSTISVVAPYAGWATVATNAKWLQASAGVDGDYTYDYIFTIPCGQTGVINIGRAGGDNEVQVLLDGISLYGMTTFGGYGFSNPNVTLPSCLITATIPAGTHTLRGRVHNIGSSVTGFLLEGCLTLTETAPLTATITGNSPICSNGSTQLCASMTGGVAPYTYNWGTSGSVIYTTGTNTNTPCYNIGSTGGISISLIPGSTTYIVTITDANGCTATASKTVTVLATPTAVITVTGTTCPKTVTASGGGTYRWNTSATTASISAATSGTYTVTVTNTAGCTATASVTVDCCNLQISELRSLIYVHAQAVTFPTPTVTGCAAGSTLTYLWEFGDGTTSTLASPTKTYTTIGIYNVCLTVTCTAANGSFCRAKCCREVNIGKNCPALYPTFAVNMPATGLAYTFTGTIQSTSVVPAPISTYEIYNSTNTLVTTLTGTNATYSFPSNGDYTVCRNLAYTADANFGAYCVNKNCRKITVMPTTGCNATAKFVATTYKANPLNVTFNASSYSTGATAYYWEYGTSPTGTFTQLGTAANAALGTPTFLFPTAAVYWVRLTINKGTPCETAIIARINLNAFTCTASSSTTPTGLRNVNTDGSIEIGNSDINDGIALYPNPTDSNVTITFGNDIKATTLIKVYDMKGQLITSFRTQEGDNQTVIDLSNQAAGMYLFHIENESGERLVKKVVKQ